MPQGRVEGLQKVRFVRFLAHFSIRKTSDWEVKFPMCSGNDMGFNQTPKALTSEQKCPARHQYTSSVYKKGN